MEAIVLAGGLGTRLRGVLPDLPKSMAPIGGRPFLALLLDTLEVGGFDAVTLAVGYRAEAIHAHFGERYRSLRLSYSTEDEPLGTGGAVRLALAAVHSAEVFVLNGDTYLDLDYRAMQAAHLQAGAVLSVAVHPVPDTARYGALEVVDGRIRGILEKGRTGPGLINAGVYRLSRELLDRYELPRVFSFESDVLVPHVGEIDPLAFEVRGTFIDIGVPEDYARAEAVLGTGAVVRRQ